MPAVMGVSIERYMGPSVAHGIAVNGMGTTTSAAAHTNTA